MNKCSENFEKAIKFYLDNRAKTDKLFAEKYSNEKKSVKECCMFILNEVQKSGCNGFTDDEVFGMAVHYYDEDNLGEIKDISCRVVVNHVVELTPEEKQKAKDEAIKKAQEDAYKQLTAKKSQKKSSNEDCQQGVLSLF